MSYLEIDNLEYRAGSFDLKASLSLEKGETGVLLGPSGCGKTSLLRCVAGLERPSGGEITVQGRKVTGLPPESRNFGYVFQDLALFDHLTGRGNLEFGLRLRGWDRLALGKRVEALADKLRIDSLLDRRPLAMSGGERQRLAFARSIAVSPELLLLDEPLSSLDAPLRRELRAFLGESLRREGVTALHVTHDVEEALELADFIFLMRKGRILAKASPRELYSRPGSAWIVSFLGLGSLLPVQRILRGASHWVAETALGPIGIALQGEEASMHGTGSAPPILFLPARAVTLDQRGQASARFKATIEEVVYAGDFLRVSARPRLPAGEDFSIEFKAPPSLRLYRGEEVELSLDPEACSLVADDR
jgi:putative spermidine/putrescine transport system ATP-binding protein